MDFDSGSQIERYMKFKKKKGKEIQMENAASMKWKISKKVQLRQTGWEKSCKGINKDTADITENPVLCVN